MESAGLQHRRGGLRLRQLPGTQLPGDVPGDDCGDPGSHQGHCSDYFAGHERRTGVHRTETLQSELGM